MTEPRPVLTDWKEIERAANEVALKALEADETTELVFGAAVAWVECHLGKTDSVSELHRVGLPIGDKPHTSCGALIPDPIRRLILSPALTRSMPSCRFCASEMLRVERPNAA